MTVVTEVLESVGLRATPQRVAILEVLRRAGEPLSIDAIETRVKGKANYVTLYRVLKQCVDAGIVYQTDFRSGKAYYELQHGDHHHHHITCTSCGKRVETHCNQQQYEAALSQASDEFSTITSHTLEFFGICTSCAPSQSSR